jgi:hypothetical protein
MARSRGFPISRTPAEAAARYLRSPCEGERRPLGAGHLEIWRTRGRSPPLVVPYYVAADGRFFRVNASWRAWERMLRESGARIDDAETLARLIRWGPGRVLVASHASDVPAARQSDDWQPRRAPNGWIVHAVDHARGRWLRLTLVNGQLRIEDLGPAPIRSLR